MVLFSKIGRLLLAIASTILISVTPAVAADMVTYSWTTTSQGFGSHVSQPTTATFDVPLTAVLSGKINYSDITNINMAYPGLTFDSYTPTGNGLDFAAFVNPVTGAFIYSDKDQGLGVIGFQGGLFSDSFLSITVGVPNSSFSGVADAFNALNNSQPYAGYPTAGFWTAIFPSTPAPGVPEPATWVTMVLGFGAIGLAIRRSRPAVRRFATVAG
jgi:hypothetical protein